MISAQSNLLYCCHIYSSKIELGLVPYFTRSYQRHFSCKGLAGGGFLTIMKAWIPWHHMHKCTDFDKPVWAQSSYIAQITCNKMYMCITIRFFFYIVLFRIVRSPLLINLHLIFKTAYFSVFVFVNEIPVYQCPGIYCCLDFMLNKLQIEQ